MEHLISTKTSYDKGLSLGMQPFSINLKKNINNEVFKNYKDILKIACRIIRKFRHYSGGHKSNIETKNIVENVNNLIKYPGFSKRYINLYYQ